MQTELAERSIEAAEVLAEIGQAWRLYGVGIERNEKPRGLVSLTHRVLLVRGGLKVPGCRYALAAKVRP